jgi:threonine-phosphate decarboxylase
MIEGHGDDAYRYRDIRSDFSSNICPNRNYLAVMSHLSAHPELISHYPEPEAWSLETIIARRHEIVPACVIVTSGATEAIYLIAQSFRMRHVTPATSFREYDDAVRQFQTHDAMHTVGWMCNPNNPTGCTCNRETVCEIARHYDLLVIDQSYEYYTAQPVMSAKSAVRHGNILQIHSMTKTYGIPGLRLGYIVTARRLADIIRRHLRPWSVSSLAIEAGKFLLQHDELICRPDLDEARRLRASLCEIEDMQVSPSDTNIILCRLPRRTAAELKEYLAGEHHILIRDASNFNGLTPQHFRVASQTPAENDALVAAIWQFLNN